MPDRSSWRISFVYENDAVRVVSRRRVAMAAQPDDRELLRGATRGFWAEVRDAEGNPLWARMLHQPVRTELEVFSPREGESPRHVAVPGMRGAFDVVVPDLPGGVELVIRGRTTAVELARRAPKQLVKVRLEEGGG